MKLEVYSGDPEWQRTWIVVGETDVGLRDFCENMAARDPTTFDEIHTDWVAWKAFVATGTATPGTAPT